MIAPLASIEERLNSPDFVRDPYPVFRDLRNLEPVYWSPSWGMWLITRFDDVSAIKRDPVRFCNAGRVAGRLAMLTPSEREELSAFRAHFAAGLIDSDPPEHTRLRAIIMRAFTPRAVEALRQRVAQLVDHLLRPLRTTGQMDVVRDFAYPLPATVIGELLGLPPGSLDQFKQWADDISRFYGSHGPDRLPAALNGQRAVLEARAWLLELAADRRAHPRDDLISALVAADAGGLNEAQLLATCVTLMVAGHETTTSLIGVGIYSLLRNADALVQFRDRPELTRPAVEELLRYESPAQKNARVVTQDVEMRGQRVRPGELVMLLVGAANRDPDQFPEPDRLDFQRADNRHVAFGVGIHFCVGAALARLEASIALPELAKLRGLRLAAADAVWQAGTNLRTLDSLQVEFDPDGCVAHTAPPGVRSWA
jgi:cytochrome P450